MKRAVLSLLLAMLFMALGSACGDDSDSPATEPPTDTGLTADEEATATSIAGAFNAVSQVGNLVIGAVRGAQPAALRQRESQAVGDSETARWIESAGTCPVVTVDSVQPRSLALSIDFGAGCTTSSGLEASGNLIVSWRGGSTVDTVSVFLESFSADGYGLDGAFSATGKGSAWTVAFAGTVTGDGEVWNIDATLGLGINNQGTPSNPDDDVTSISGGGTLGTGDQSYEVAITQTLVFHTDCSYPLTGTLTYQEESDGPTPSPVYGIDFGVGDCCTVKVSVGNRSEDMNLCTAG